MTTQERKVRSSMIYDTLRVIRKKQISPRMVRVTFTAENPASLLDSGPDQYSKVFFPAPGQRHAVIPPLDDDDGVMGWYRQYLAISDELRPPMRTYTVRAQRPAVRELDIDFVLHPEHGGPASEWAAQAAPGDEVGFICPPRATYAPQTGAAWQLLVGDETALPAIGAILERLEPGQIARVFVEVAGPEEQQHIVTRGDVQIDWIARDGRPHAEAVVDALKAAVDLPPGEPCAWISGEADLVKYTRRHLVRERDIPKSSITFTGYWRRGSTEDDGRQHVGEAATGAPGGNR